MDIDNEVQWLARRIAAAAPWEQGKYSTGTVIPWSLILELRAALDNQGVDWKVLKRPEG